MGVEADHPDVPASSAPGSRSPYMASRRLLAALTLACAATAAAAPLASGQAGGASQLVSGRVAPIVGTRMLADGSMVGGSTVDSEVIRERRGNTLVITVVP